MCSRRCYGSMIFVQLGSVLVVVVVDMGSGHQPR